MAFDTLPFDSYAAFCKEKNIERVAEPDRMNIAKCVCYRPLRRRSCVTPRPQVSHGR
jgi:hypothetical protein